MIMVTGLKTLKIISLILPLWSISLACYSQEPFLSTPKKEGTVSVPSVHTVIKPPAKPLEVNGVIEAITLAEPSKGIRPELSLLGSDGKRYLFLVRSTTTIYGHDWKPITLDRLRAGEHIRVQYLSNKEGLLVVLSIKPAR